MKTTPTILALVMVSTALTGCGPARTADQKAPVKHWLTAKEAEVLVQKDLKAGKVKPTKFSLIEQDDPDVRAGMGAQLFRVAGEAPGRGAMFDACLIADGKVHWIAGGWGGLGLTSYCVGDVDADGAPELVYTYSWGSGIGRSRLAVVSRRNGYRPVDFSKSFWESEWVVRKAADGRVELLEGRLKGRYPYGNPGTRPPLVPNRKIGVVTLKTRNGKSELSVKFEPGLPESIKRDLKWPIVQ